MAVPKRLMQESNSPLAGVVRYASPGDVDGIFRIYNREILESLSTFEEEPYTTDGRRLAWLRASDRAVYAVLVYERDGQIIGFAKLEPWSTRPGYRRTAEDSVYVAPQEQGNGVATVLLTQLLDHARTVGIRVVVARINGGPSGAASRRLHEKLGFQEAGVIPRLGEKFGQVLDIHFYSHSLEDRGGF